MSVSSGKGLMFEINGVKPSSNFEAAKGSLLAQTGPEREAGPCPLLGVEQT